MDMEKLIEVLERQKCLVYTKDEEAVNQALWSAYFKDL